MMLTRDAFHVPYTVDLCMFMYASHSALCEYTSLQCVTAVDLCIVDLLCLKPARVDDMKDIRAVTNASSAPCSVASP